MNINKLCKKFLQKTCKVCGETRMTELNTYLDLCTQVYEISKPINEDIIL